MFKKNWVVLPMLLGSAAYAQQDTTVAAAKQNLQEVVVSGIKATSIMPITQTTILSKQIAERYYGADVPTVINYTPSINMVSDNGTGIGYSSFRLRGMDQTRINTTVNGIPVNDAENQGVYFNNFADLMSSAESVQIQRGIGTSTNGTSAFGGSVNIQTKNLSEQAEVNVNVGYGSFNSQRATMEFQSGLLQNRFMFYGRYSHISTDGYRDNSGSTIRSYAFSGAYKMKNALLKVNMFGGYAENQLAYTGLDKTTLDNNRKTNPFTNGETDAFKQQFYQVQCMKQFSQRSNVSASAYYVRGMAPKFQFLFPGTWGYGYDYFNMPNAIVGNDTLTTAGDMMTSYRLDQHYYGAFANYNFKSKKLDFVTGVHANRMESTHFMDINWGSVLPAGIMQNHQVYSNTGYKSEASAFAKATYKVTSKCNVFGDAQLRYAMFSYTEKQMAIRNYGYKVDDMNWTFLNWRLGTRYFVNDKSSVYAMVGQSHREPTRFDYFQDDFATRDTKQNDIKPEEVTDIEVGFEHNGRKLTAKINGYAMLFNNQIIGLGQLNVFGYPITTNVKNSSRMGVETELVYQVNKKISLSNYSSFSSNMIKSIDQHYRTTYATNDTVITYTNVALVLSPSVIINQGVKFDATQWLSLEVMYRYVGMQYLDNTGDKNVSAPAFNYLDGRLAIKLNRWIKTGIPMLSLRVNNILNEKYSTSGSIASGTNTMDASGVKGTTPLYYPAAGINFFTTLSWKF